MENWENNIIEKKLNNLKTLPEGYKPDLLSKWEIIEAGLPKQKKKIAPFYKWMAAATIIGVLFYSVNIIFLNKQIQAGLELSRNKILTEAIVALDKQPEKEIKVIQTIDLNQKKIIAINKTLITKKENEKLLVEKKSLIKIEIPVFNNANLNGITHVPTTVESTLLATTQPEITKPTKRKVFQKDFVDEVLTLGTSNKVATEHSIFKIQLNKKLSEENGQSSPALQWKKSL